MRRTQYLILNDLSDIKNGLIKNDNKLNVSPYKLTGLARIIEMQIEDMLYEAEPTILN